MVDVAEAAAGCLMASTLALVIWAWCVKKPPRQESLLASRAVAAPATLPRLQLLQLLRALPPPPPGHKLVTGLLKLTGHELVPAGNGGNGGGGAQPRHGGGGNGAGAIPSGLSWKPASLKRRRKMTLVLDLDETLVHSSGSMTDPQRLHGGTALRHDLHLKIERRHHDGGTDGDRAAAAHAPNGTLGSSSGGGEKSIYVWRRPHLTLFLREASKMYELVVYTAGQRRYADPLIDQIDPDGIVRRRYFRESCTAARALPADAAATAAALAAEAAAASGGASASSAGACSASAGSKAAGGGRYLKDLAQAVAPEHWPERAVLVDNSPCAYARTCPRNAIPIAPWFGTNPRDDELLRLLPFLAALAAVSDVRSVLGLRTDPSPLRAWHAAAPQPPQPPGAARGNSSSSAGKCVPSPVSRAAKKAL